MLDSNSVYPLIGLGFVTSFFATLFSGGIGKIISVVAGLPVIIFIISIAYSVIQVQNTHDLNPVATGIADGLPPIIITAVGEAFGTPCGRGLRILIKWILNRD